jgi:hypothetical protein
MAYLLLLRRDSRCLVCLLLIAGRKISWPWLTPSTIAESFPLMQESTTCEKSPCDADVYLIDTVACRGDIPVDCYCS